MYINCIPVHKSQQQLYWNHAAAVKTIDFNDTSFAMGYKHDLECQCRKREKVKDSNINGGCQTWNNQECSWILCIPAISRSTPSNPPHRCCVWNDTKGTSQACGKDSSAKRSLEFPELNEHLITLSCMSYVVTVPQTPMIMPIILPLLISRIIFRKLNACCSYPNWIKKIQA